MQKPHTSYYRRGAILFFYIYCNCWQSVFFLALQAHWLESCTAIAWQRNKNLLVAPHHHKQGLAVWEILAWPSPAHFLCSRPHQDFCLRCCFALSLSSKCENLSFHRGNKTTVPIFLSETQDKDTEYTLSVSASDGNMDNQCGKHPFPTQRKSLHCTQ